jgi:hypothetical protein
MTLGWLGNCIPASFFVVECLKASPSGPAVSRDLASRAAHGAAAQRPIVPERRPGPEVAA